MKSKRKMSALDSEIRQRIQSFIPQFMSKKGYWPSFRDIGRAVNLVPSNVHFHLKVLKAKKLVTWNKGVPHSIRPTNLVQAGLREFVRIPLLGNIVAGLPVPTYPTGDEMIELPRNLLPNSEDYFALKVRGDSMIDAYVCDGDTVVIKKQDFANVGDMIAAGLANGEDATLKYLDREGEQYYLRPANPNYKKIEIVEDDLRVYGKVVFVLRNLIN